MSPRITTFAFHLGLVLALSTPVSFVGAQSPASSAVAKPKPKLSPRPLPGSNIRGDQSGPSTGDITTAETASRAKVPLYRPASVQRTGTTLTDTTANKQAAEQYSERARIVAVRRRGTFPVPATVPSETTPALVNETRPSSAAADPVPTALPPGKIRVIPKEMIKVGTPAAENP